LTSRGFLAVPLFLYNSAGFGARGGSRTQELLLGRVGPQPMDPARLQVIESTRKAHLASLYPVPDDLAVAEQVFQEYLA